MAGTVETDITIFSGATAGTTAGAADTTTDWTTFTTRDTETMIEGTACNGAKLSNTLGTAVLAITSTDLRGKIIYAWMMSVTRMDTLAGGGFRIGVGDGTNTGDWFVGGRDTYLGGWQRFCAYVPTADADAIYDVQSGTPALNAITRIRLGYKPVAAATKTNCYVDAVAYGTYLRIRAGTSGDPATFQDILDYDTTSVLGVFREISGIIFQQVPLQIGSTTASENTYFKDVSSPIILTLNAKVPKETFEYTLQGGTNDTEIYFGQANVSGPIIKMQPSANYAFPLLSCYSYNANTTTYTDRTTAVNNTTTNDVVLPPIQTTTLGDAIYFGHRTMFNRVRLTLGTAGVYTNMTLAWQYYNGSSWTALPDVSDLTSYFTAAAGTYNIDFSPPYWDWTQVAVNSQTRYWIRCVVTAWSSQTLTTAPLGTQGWLRQYNPFRFTASNTSIDKFGINGTTFFNAGTITLQAYNADKIFTGCSVIASEEMIPNTCSVESCNFVSATYRAIRISSASHNVTTCNFIDCYVAIHHDVGGSSGTPLEYDYDALMFSDGTYDIENSAVTPDFYIDIDRINGSNPDSGKLLNSGGGTIALLEIGVVLTLKCVDKNNNALNGIRCIIEKVSDGTALLNEETANVAGEDGIATETYLYPGSSVPIIIRARKSSTGGTKYTPFSSVGTIDGDFSMTIVMYQDTNVSS